MVAVPLGNPSVLWLVYIIVPVVLSGGCRTSAGPEAAPVNLPVKMVWAGHQCGGPSPAPSVQWIGGPQKLDAAPFQRSAARVAVERVSMDWTRYGLVWIRMGRKPTGGFGLRLAVSEAVVRQGVAVVTVQWREPPQGAYVTQMIPSPCMLLKLPRGDYKEVVIENRAGRVHVRAAVDPAG